MQKLLIGFAGLVVILGAWSFLAGKGLPWHQSSQGQRGSRRQGQGQNGQDGYQDEPEGDPADWSREEMKAWLQKVSLSGLGRQE